MKIQSMPETQEKRKEKEEKRKNFVEFFSAIRWANIYIQPFHPPPSINQRKTPLYPRKEYEYFPLPLPFSPSKFLSHLPANVNYNLNMNIGACIGAVSFHDSARTRDPACHERKKGGEREGKWRETYPEKLHPVRRKSINIHSHIEISPLGVFTQGNTYFTTPDPFSRAPSSDLSSPRAHLFE